MLGRSSGILLHITSLPSPFGVGDLGPWSYRFADFLARAGQRFWQILPLSPTDTAHGNSPYHSNSAFALNPLFISPELLVRDGLLSESDLEADFPFPGGRVDYAVAGAFKDQLLKKAYVRILDGEKGRALARFREENVSWVEDFALFKALSSRYNNKMWGNWPVELRDRHPDALSKAREELRDPVEKEIFYQYVFYDQWMSLKQYCNDRGILVIGDLPFYVDYDSADLWSHPELFKLDETKRPYVGAGVPPDYFSETGQLWGNPIYRWDVLKESGYAWWLARLRRNFELFDMVRIDHFRGLVAYWEVPSGEKSAINGKWEAGPAEDFLEAVFREFPGAPLIAEDLGYITPDVTAVMERFGLPGMKLLLFAFGPDLPTNPYAPHNLVKNCLVYTGTHDNNTAGGWFEKEASPEEKERLSRYAGRTLAPESAARELVRLAMMSVADTAIIPMQDILSLGAEARMNVPATPRGNWEWRLTEEQLTPEVADELRRMTEIYGRIQG
ncbi:MAG: 4-alpha-glucanotransferase [Deltaproteobacteria bacterium]|nr:4-alpha-glucanotransferase [Deltaproteobacteria bacterium]MBW2284853.1 4-alpha-glucanotransferase [Deltaproteobacteria bacterium]